MAILLNEPDQASFHNALLSTAPIISMATCIELGFTVLRRIGPGSVPVLATLLEDYEVEFVPVDAAQADLALEAMLTYGKGRGRPPAVLNYGDLFSYALAKARGLPLLYKGDDFAQTDIPSALTMLAGATGEGGAG